MKEGKGETAWVLMELSAEAWEARRGWGALRPTAAWQGLPGGGSHHFLPLWEHERITPSPHLYFLYVRSSEGQRQGVIPIPHLYAGKVPSWASPDTTTLGGWGRLGEAGGGGGWGEVGITTWEEAEWCRL